MSITNARAAMTDRNWRAALDHLNELDPGDDPAQAYHLSGTCFLEVEDLDEALWFAQQAVHAKPTNAAAWCQLGVAHQLLAGAGPNHYLEAHICFERAYNMAPGNPTAATGLACSFYTLRQHEAALDMFRVAQRPGPNPKAKLAEAGVLLTLGRFKEGWEKLDARLELPDLPQVGFYTGSLMGLRDKTVVIRAEQGNGDVIQFLRYVPKVRSFCRNLILEVWSGMETLAKALVGTHVDKIVTSVYEAKPDAVSISLLSLPRLLGPMFGVAPFKPMVVPKEFHNPMRHGVGICPSSLQRENSPYSNSVARRKTPPREMIEAIGSEIGDYVSLTHADLGASDWLGTAQVIADLDLVITVDTGVAHLAATLGIETWVMQRFDACWRWVDPRWYPTARVFHQSAPGDWDSVYRQIVEALQAR
jgi:hypothetical protein